MDLSWLDNTTESRDRIRTKKTAQMLIKPRLMVIEEVITEYQPTGKFNLVPTIETKANHLTRVAKKRLCYQEPESTIEAPPGSGLYVLFIKTG